MDIPLMSPKRKTQKKAEPLLTLPVVFLNDCRVKLSPKTHIPLLAVLAFSSVFQ